MAKDGQDMTAEIDDDCCHSGTGWEVHKNTYSTCYTQDRFMVHGSWFTEGRLPPTGHVRGKFETKTSAPVEECHNHPRWICLFWARLGNSQVLVSAATLRCSHLANTAPFLTIASNIEKEYVDSVLLPKITMSFKTAFCANNNRTSGLLPVPVGPGHNTCLSWVIKILDFNMANKGTTFIQSTRDQYIRFCLPSLIRTYTCTPSEMSWSIRQECEPSLWKAYTNRTESTEGTTWHRGIVKIDGNSRL